MKIRIYQPGNLNMVLPFPDWILWNPVLLKIGIRIGKHYTDQVPELTDKAIDALCREIRKVKKRYGSWELIRVEDTDGELVTITL